uniref:Galectin n=1 Tax=Heterocephalus glaber TaxID=10181 RepID=A0A0P6K1B7_HETGA
MAGSLNVPHKISLPDTVHAGSVMRIRGSVPENASRFHVNLLLSEGQDSDAALHFNPRMDEAVVVLNSKASGKWGREERGMGLPFQRGQPFDLLLIATEDGFKAVVEDTIYYHFRHRLPMGNVRLLEVAGDVQLQSVTMV